jgi:DNA polymerase lambda
MFDLVREEAQSLDKNLWIDVMGSYRRGAETSGDVDFLITRDTADGKDHAGILSKLVGRLKSKGIITHDVSHPMLSRAVDVRLNIT